MNGDIYTNLKIENLLNYHNKEKNDFTLCCHSHSFQVPYGVINPKTSKILIFINTNRLAIIDSLTIIFN